MTQTTLRDGSTTQDPRLDRLVEFDEASRRFGVMRTITHTYPRSRSYRCPFHFDQGREGRCVEYAFVHDLVAYPVMVALAIVQEILRLKAIYWPAQRDDPWPGGSYPGASPHYEGTSVLAGVKRLQALGFITGYSWAFGIREVVMALAWRGPVIFGLDWFTGMFRPDADGWIQPTGRVEGGHALLGKAVRLRWLKGTTTAQKRSADWYSHLDLDASHVVLHQSWGEDHGVGGDVKISLRDLDYLLNRRGECVILEGRRKTNSAPIAA